MKSWGEAKDASDQKRDHGAGVIGQILNDFGPPIGSDTKRATVNLLRQHGENLYEEGHGADVIVVPEGAET